MRKRILSALALAGALLFAGSVARAQTQTNVTATVLDPIGIPYANGTYSVQLIPTGTNPTVNGNSIGGAFNGRLDANGSFNISLWPNASILPAASTWQFTICESPGVAPPLGTGGQCTPPTAVTIAGATQSLSATLSAVAPALTAIALGSGGVTSVSGTAPIVATPNPITGVGAISCPTCNTSSASIAGTIAATQVAFGTALDTIGGSNDLTFNSATDLLTFHDPVTSAVNLMNFSNNGTYSCVGVFCIQGFGGQINPWSGATTLLELHTEDSSPEVLVFTNGAIASPNAHIEFSYDTGEDVDIEAWGSDGVIRSISEGLLAYKGTSPGITINAATIGDAINITAPSILFDCTSLTCGSRTGSVTINAAAGAVNVVSEDGMLPALSLSNSMGAVGQLFQTYINTDGTFEWDISDGTKQTTIISQAGGNIYAGLSTGGFSFGNFSTQSTFAQNGGLTVPTFGTATNCADSAGAAACGSAAAGSFVIDAASTSTVVSTTAVTANSEIFVQYDSSLGARLGSITCNVTAAIPSVTARTAATSFTVTIPAGPVTNPACYSYHIVN